jgi:hypothetical protein
VTNTVNVSGGVYASAYLANQSNTKYVLQGDVTANASAIQVDGNYIIIDLNGHTVTYNQNATGSGIKLNQDYNKHHLAVVNGSIVQGADACEGDLNGHGCNPITMYMSQEIDSGNCSRGSACDMTQNFGASSQYAHIANLYVKTKGKDVSGIDLRGNYPIVEHVTVEDDYEFGTLKFRDFGTKAINILYGAYGSVRHCTVKNARQTGISGADYSKIHDNHVTTRTISTNGPGVAPGLGCEVYSNVIIGRGEHAIGIFCVVKDPGYVTKIYDNEIDVKTTALGNEYGTAYLADKDSTILGNFAVGFRSTWGIKGIEFYNNSINGTSDSRYEGTYSPTGETAYINGGVRGLMVGGYGDGPVGYTGGDEYALFYNNTITVIDKDGTGDARGIACVHNFSDSVFFIENTITSNIHSVVISDDYGTCEHFPMFKNNTHIKDGSYARYRTYANGLGGYYTSEARIVDEYYEGGASAESLLMYADLGNGNDRFPRTDIYYGTYNATTDEYYYYKRVHDANNTSAVLITDTFDPMITLDYANPGDSPASAECDADHLGLCVTESTCTAVGGYWCDGECQSTPCPAEDPGDPDPEDPTPTPTTSGPILRTGSHLLRIGDGVLMAQ